MTEAFDEGSNLKSQGQFFHGANRPGHLVFKCEGTRVRDDQDSRHQRRDRSFFGVCWSDVREFSGADEGFMKRPFSQKDTLRLKVVFWLNEIVWAMGKIKRTNKDRTRQFLFWRDTAHINTGSSLKEL